MPTSEVIILSSDPKLGAIDYCSYSAIAEHALNNLATTQPSTAVAGGASLVGGAKGGRLNGKVRSNSVGKMGREVSKVATQTDVLLFTILRQASAVISPSTKAKSLSSSPADANNAPTRTDITRPIVTLPFLSLWAQQATADGTVGMILSELHKVALAAEGPVGGRRRGGFGESNASGASAVRHVTLAVPCVAPSVMPLLFARQQAVLDGAQGSGALPESESPVGIPPIVACIEMTSSKASSPHHALSAALSNHSPNLFFNLPTAPVAVKKGAAGGGGGSQQANASASSAVPAGAIAVDLDGAGQLHLSTEMSSVDHMTIQLVRPFCGGVGSVSVAALTPQAPVQPVAKGQSGKKGGKSSSPERSGVLARPPQGAIPNGIPCQVVPTDHPVPRAVGVAIARRLRDLLVTVHTLCTRYFVNSMRNPILASTGTMLSAEGVTYFDNCVSAFRRAERLRSVVIAQSAAPPAPVVTLPASKSGTRAAAAAAVQEAEQQSMRPDVRAAFAEKELIEALLTEASKGIAEEGRAPPPNPTPQGKGSSSKAQPIAAQPVTSAPALYAALAAFSRHRHATAVDVHVASLLVATASQIPLANAIMNAYSTQPPVLSAASSAPTGKHANSAPSLALPRVQACDFSLVEGQHVRNFFTTPPPLHIFPSPANAKGGGGPVAVQMVPMVALAGLPSVLMNIMGSLCGVQEAIQGEMRCADGIVDAASSSRSLPLPLTSAAERLLGHLKDETENVDASLFKTKCPHEEVPLLWCPPPTANLDAVASQPPLPTAVVTPSSPSRGAAKASAAATAASAALTVVPERTPQASMTVSAFHIGQAYHHDGCSVFRAFVEPFPSPVITSAMLCEGIRSSVVELSKVRAATRYAPPSANVAASGERWDRRYQTLVQATKSISGGASIRGSAAIVAPNADSVGDLLSAITARAVDDETLQVLEVVDVEKNNLRMLNRALAETRVRVAAVDRERRQQKRRDENVSNAPVEVVAAPPPTKSNARGGKERNVSPASRKTRASSVPPQPQEAPIVKDAGVLESLSDEQRGNSVLKRSDPLPRKTLPNGQPSFIYVQSRSNVVAQNADETEVVRAILAPDEPKVSGRELSRRFVGAFFKKAFGGPTNSAPPPLTAPTTTIRAVVAVVGGLAAAPPHDADPSGLVDDKACEDGTAEEDTFAAQKRRVDTVMALRQVSQVVGSRLPQEVGVATSADARDVAFLSNISQASSRRVGQQSTEEPAADDGGDSTGAIALLSQASVAKVHSSSAQKAPVVNSSAQVTSWINKTLSPTEQQFLLDQCVLNALVKANYSSLTPGFTTACHYYTEDNPTASLLPPAVAKRAEQMFALFPSNVHVSVGGSRLEHAFEYGSPEPLRSNAESSFIRNSRLLDTAGYFAVGLTRESTAAVKSQRALNACSSVNSALSMALDSNERKRVGRWSYAAVVGSKAQYEFTLGSLSNVVSSYANPLNDAADMCRGGDANDSTRQPPMPNFRAASQTPIPQLRDDLPTPFSATSSPSRNPPAAEDVPPHPPFVLPPTTTAPLFTLAQSRAGGLPGVGGRRIVRGERCLVMPYDGSIVEATSSHGESNANGGMIKYHRPDVTVAGHYQTALSGAARPTFRITATYHDTSAAGERTPLVTLEGDSMSITDREAHDRLSVVTKVSRLVGRDGVPSDPKLSFSSISADLSGALGGMAAEGKIVAGNGVATRQRDAAPSELFSAAASMKAERDPLIAISRQLRAVTAAAGAAPANAPPPVAVIPSSPAKTKAKGRSNSPAVTSAVQVAPLVPEVTVERSLLSAAMSAATRVVEARCTAKARAIARRLKLKAKRRAMLPHYQTNLLSLNAETTAACGDDTDTTDRGHNRSAPMNLVGYSAWFERDGPNGGHSLRVGLRQVPDLEQAREVCNVTGVVTIRYISGSTTKLFPDGSTATLMIVPSDLTIGYYTAVSPSESTAVVESEAPAYRFTSEPHHASLGAAGWTLRGAHPANSDGPSAYDLRVAASVANASGGSLFTPDPSTIANRPARPPSPNASRGTASSKVAAPNASVRREGRQGGFEASMIRPASATLASACDSASSVPNSVIGPLPITLPKYWLLTAPSGNRCARRCEGSILDAAHAPPPPTSDRGIVDTEWRALLAHCNALMPPIASPPPLSSAVSFDAQNLCNVISRSDGVIFATYNAATSGAHPVSPPRDRNDAAAQRELNSILLGAARDSTVGKGQIRVALHSDGTTIVSVVPAPTSAAVPSLSNFVPIPTHLPALDGLIQFLSSHAVDKCGGDTTTLWPESLGLSHREGGALATSLSYLVEHPRFPRVLLRRNGPWDAPRQSPATPPLDMFAMFSDESLLACELVNLRIPNGAGGGPKGLASATERSSAAQLPFFHTRFVRPNGTTLRVMNPTGFGASKASAESSGTSPVLIVEPSHIAVGLQSPYRQLLVALATQAVQAKTSILGNVPTSLSGKARHLATVATSAALHESCPVFALTIPSTSSPPAALMRLVDKRNFVTTVSSASLAVGFRRLATEELLMRLAPQGLVTHVVSKRRQMEEEERRRANKGDSKIASSATAVGPLETSLRVVSRSFIVKYALIGTPQVNVFYRLREDVLGSGATAAAGGGGADKDGADSRASMSPTSVAQGGTSRMGPGPVAGLLNGRGEVNNPAHMTEAEAVEVSGVQSYDYAPHMYIVRCSATEEGMPIVYSRLLSAHDLSPFIRTTIAQSNSGPTASDLTSTANEEDDIADKCLAIFPSDAAGPVLSTVITAGKSVVSGEPHIEQIHFYASSRVPATLKGHGGAGIGGAVHRDPSSSMRGTTGGVSSQAAVWCKPPPLHRPSYGVCAWLPKTVLPPKRLLLQEATGQSASTSDRQDPLLLTMLTMSAARGGASGEGLQTINALGQGHSLHTTRVAKQFLRFTRYSPVIRDAVAAVRLAAEGQRKSMVHYTRGVIDTTSMEIERGRESGVDALRAKYQHELEAIKKGAKPSMVSTKRREVSHSSVGAVSTQRLPSRGSIDDVDVAEEVVVLALEGVGPDDAFDDDDVTSAKDNTMATSPQEAGSDRNDTAQHGYRNSTNTARERAIVYLNQRMDKPQCGAIVACDPFPEIDFGNLPVPVFDDREYDSAYRAARGLSPTAPLPPSEPIYPFKYRYKGMVRNLTNDTVLLTIRNPAKKVDERTGERTLTSAISVVEGGNMRLGPNGSAPFVVQLETTTNELVRRSLGDALSHIAHQEEARKEAAAEAEASGTTPPRPRRFVMDLSERLRVDVVGAVEPLILHIRASLVLNASLKERTIPKPEVLVRTN